MKLTKKAISDFVSWSSTRYNDYLGYGTKKEAVLTAFHSIDRGYVVKVYVYTKGKRKGDIEYREDNTKNTIELTCASPLGEHPTNKRGSSRYWATKQSGGSYIVDCARKTITSSKTGEFIQFD